MRCPWDNPWGEANKDALVRYVQGLASAFRFMRDPETRDELIKTIVDTTGSSEEIARQTVSLYFEPDRGVVPKQGELDLKGLGQVIQFMSETGNLQPPLPSPERFVDLQYLRAAGIQ
jgi:ABC-type nitrate/sulfonate/bicarbonate transport system substrate-binding protein